IRALLEAARADDGGPAARARVRAAVSARLAIAEQAPSDGGPGSRPPASAPGSAVSTAAPAAAGPIALSLGKAGLLALVTGALGFAAGFARGTSPPPAALQAAPAAQSHAALASNAPVPPEPAATTPPLVVPTPLPEPAPSARRGTADARSGA